MTTNVTQAIEQLASEAERYAHLAQNSASEARTYAEAALDAAERARTLGEAATQTITPGEVIQQVAGRRKPKAGE